MIILRPPRCAGVVAVLLALSACVSGLKNKAPAPQTYVLQPAYPADAPAGPTMMSNAARAQAGTLQVLQGTVAAGLDTDAIAVLRPGLRFDYYSGAHWAVSVPAMVRMLAIDALRRLQRYSAVESDSGPFAPDLVLNLEVEHFEAQYGDSGPPTIHVALLCTLGSRTDRGTLATFTAESRVRADSDRMQSVVAAFERASGEVMAQVAANATQPAATRPLPP